MSVVEHEPNSGEPVSVEARSLSKADTIFRIKEILNYERTQGIVDRSRLGGEYEPLAEQARLTELAQNLINEYNDGQVARDSDGLTP
jgi:hypothetical protein